MASQVFDTMRKRRYVCECGAVKREIKWGKDVPPTCDACTKIMDEVGEQHGNAATVIGDEIDVVIQHGPVNPDGSPRRYRSRAELKRESARLGWTAHGDTPVISGSNERKHEQERRQEREYRASRG